MRGVENLLSAEVEVARNALSGAGEPTFRPSGIGANRNAISIA